MSYCRNNGQDSDVYVIGTRNPGESRNFLQCFCGTRCDSCGQYTQPFPSFTTRSGMIAHLREHRVKGDKVPDRAFERLEKEIRESGDEM
jgi:hypothetical protein